LVGLGETRIYHHLWNLTMICDFTWRVPECEELVGGSHRRMGVF
jgi:hypothetical protein